MFINIGGEQVEEFTVNNAVNIMQVLFPTKILLDNQADISIVHPSLLEDVKKVPKSIKVKGIGNIQLAVDNLGELNGFFKVHASKKNKAFIKIIESIIMSTNNKG